MRQGIFGIILIASIDWRGKSHEEIFFVSLLHVVNRIWLDLSQFFAINFVFKNDQLRGFMQYQK